MKEVSTLRTQEWIHSEESAQKIPPANLLNPIGILKALRADRHSHSRVLLLLRLRVPVLGELDGASYAPGLKEKDLPHSIGVEAGKATQGTGKSHKLAALGTTVQLCTPGRLDTARPVL